MTRLELCGAVIVARLLDYSWNVLEIPVTNMYAWTDSTVILSWVWSSPRRFKPFVSNCVAEIMDLVPKNDGGGSHIPSTTNPANSASRGLCPHELASYRLWWDGLSWLLQALSD